MARSRSLLVRLNGRLKFDWHEKALLVTLRDLMLRVPVPPKPFRFLLHLDAALKRLLDLGLAGVGLLASWPLWILIGLAIKVEDPGPAFYQQRRVGKDGRVFSCLKFRSMRVESGGTDAAPTAENDPRITRVGRVLRATAMDELPQLWNIFAGDMSFVGPRPEWDELVAKFRREVCGFDRRHAVRPGLTGLAQVYGDSETPRSRKLRYDLFYIKKRSLGLDLRLIVTSFLITFLGRWEHRGPKLVGRGRGAATAARQALAEASTVFEMDEGGGEQAVGPVSPR